MALGNIIGSGIFLASGMVISIAGAWAPLAYLFGGLIMMMEVAFLIEMSIIDPVPGAFKVHAQEVFGEWWGFVIGWMFWTSGILGMASEVTACAIFARLWLPEIPLWLFSLFFAFVITLINLNDLKGLSKFELVLAVTKVIALVFFVIAGMIATLGFPVGETVHNFTPFAEALQSPVQGIFGLLASMLLILFAYTGTGIIGIAATETERAAEVVPPATRIVTISIVFLYTLSAFFIVVLLPSSALDVNTSPFVTLFRLANIPYSGDVVNFILLTATLSALNSQVYSSSRMLFSLARNGQAPKITAYQNQKGVPVSAVWLSGSFLLFTALLSYVLPETIFIYTVSASGFLALVNWMSVSATHYFYRKKIQSIAPEKITYKAPFYPYLSWICFFMILLTVLSAALYPDQLPGLYAGGIILFIIGTAYFLLPKGEKR
ncbi:putative membrane protein [Propionispora sp. 2/2-37]|nr:putative membrane protein [Propionispora sp. 2/2-37]